MKANEIVEVLEKLKVSSYYKKIMIDGDWGIGKTKYILDIKEKDSNICYISLFGKKDIESVMQEIYSYLIEDQKIKKGTKYIKEKLEGVTLGYQGFSISVSQIGNLHSALNKELGDKNLIIIVFDDLERKHPDLDIREVFGLIDALSKIDNVKNVLVAAEDKMEKKEVFTDYKEKAIDKVYKVTSFADDAPSKILGEEVWEILEEYIKGFKFKNLRTFEKTALFIEEVIDELGPRVFTEKFTKSDVYKMCFATILFKIEHKSEKYLLESDDSLRDYKIRIYDSGNKGTVSYIDDYILKNSLDNPMSKDVLNQIFNWYDSGSFPKEINCLINAINSFEGELGNFYSSEEKIRKVIKQAEEYIEKLHEEEQIEDIISKICIALTWCEILDINFGKSDDAILKSIETNISNRIDLNKSYYKNQVRFSLIHIESERGKRISSLIEDTLKERYQDLMVEKIKKLFEEKLYDVLFLRNFSDFLLIVRNQQTRNKIVDVLRDNQYFFPLPIHEINESQWFWCHQINIIIKDIEKNWGIDNYYDDFVEYIYKLNDGKENKLLNYRLSNLFKK